MNSKSGRLTKRKRWNYEQQSVFSYMLPGETYKNAKVRLDYLWSKGEHPFQIQNTSKPE